MLGNQKDSRPGVIVVSDPKNRCDEDRLFVKSLRDYGLTVEETSLEQIVRDHEYITVEVVVARDCWPAQNEDHDPFKINKLTLLDLARRSVLRLWNTPDGRGDQTGKDYLVKLSRDEQLSSFTIPTAYLGEGIASLPIAERYVIKPVDGLSTLGISVATRQGLEKLESELSGSSDCNLIVQPEMSFNAERSFFFIDGKFQYCLDFKPSKIPDWPDPELVEPIDQTLQVAEKFVEWNGMSRGVQRIDTILLDDGSVRLLEIEDFTPYLSLLELPEEIREKGLKALVDSVRSYCDEVSSTSLDASEE